MNKEIEIPEGYEARIEGNKVILEQKESENERIREVIESIIRVYGKTQGEWLAGYDMDTLVVHLRDAFAYLEKQKEQKPEEKISVSEELYEHIRNACACIEDAMSSDTMCDMTDYLTMADSSAQKAFDMVERLVIKKLAEWSEEDTYIIEDAVTAVDLLGNDDEYSKTHPNLAKAFRAAKDWLKALPERFNLQAKQEWSEGDEGLIDLAVAAVEDFYDEKNPIRVEIIKLLKSLRPQPHQTVEDESVSKEILEYFNEKKDYRSRWYVWVKYASRNPRWKPSKEQILAIVEALKYIPNNKEEWTILENLMHDLQKLL